jgi:hypothetical protein
MVELASYSSVDWSDSAVSLVKAKALKSKSPKAILVRDSYLNTKKGVCPLGWTMALAPAVTSPKSRLTYHIN